MVIAGNIYQELDSYLLKSTQRKTQESCFVSTRNSLRPFQDFALLMLYLPVPERL